MPRRRICCKFHTSEVWRLTVPKNWTSGFARTRDRIRGRSGQDPHRKTEPNPRLAAVMSLYRLMTSCSIGRAGWTRTSSVYTVSLQGPQVLADKRWTNSSAGLFSTHKYWTAKHRAEEAAAAPGILREILEAGAISHRASDRSDEHRHASVEGAPDAVRPRAEMTFTSAIRSNGYCMVVALEPRHRAFVKCPTSSENPAGSRALRLRPTPQRRRRQTCLEHPSGSRFLVASDAPVIAPCWIVLRSQSLPS